MIDFLTFLSDDEALHKFNDNISGLAGLIVFSYFHLLYHYQIHLR